MKEKTFVFLRFFTFVGLLLGLAGCNLWSGLHEDGKESNASVLVADGRAAMDRGDYNKAVQYFQQAMDNDPRSSEARMGLAEAMLKARHFNLSAFIGTLVTGSQTSGSPGTPPVLVKPQDWECRTYTELADLFTLFISTLDPIAQGQTYGPYVSTDPTLNLNVGFFYLLQAAALSQTISVTLVVERLSKSSQTPASLGITQAQFDLLPDQFYWIVNVPNPAVIATLQNDVDTGLARLTTARNNSSSGAQKTLDDVIQMFQSLQVQVHL